MAKINLVGKQITLLDAHTGIMDGRRIKIGNNIKMVCGRPSACLSLPASEQEAKEPPPEITIGKIHDFDSERAYMLHVREKNIAMGRIPKGYPLLNAFLGAEWANKATDFIHEAAREWNANSRSAPMFTTDVRDPQPDWGEFVSFAEGACDFFGVPEEERANVVYGMQDMLVELADQMAAGKGDSLDTLRSTIKFNDVELSLSQIVKLQKGLKEVVNGIEGFEDYAGCASVGLSVSAFRMFAEKNFDKDLSKSVASIYEKKVEAGFEHLIDLFPANHYGTPGTKDYYYMQNIDINDGQTLISNGYKTFAGLDTSSEDAFAASFDKACDWFYKEVDAYLDMFGTEKGYGHGRWRTLLNGMYKIALSLSSVDAYA